MTMTYCASECENKKCKRHFTHAFKNITCSWAYFYEDEKCEEFEP